MNRKQLLFALVALAIVVLGAAAWYVFFGNESESAVPTGTEHVGVTISAWDRTLGSPKAPILMVEYAAPVCPHCARFDETLFPSLKQNYIDKGKVYYVFRVFPLQPADVAAEGIARCLPEDNYFQFIDLLFRNQPKWDPEYRVPDVHAGLVAMGRIAGLSEQQVDTCMQNQQVAQKTNQVATDATNKYGVNGTPTFVINGQVHSTFEDWQELQTYLDQLLSKK